MAKKPKKAPDLKQEEVVDGKLNSDNAIKLIFKDQNGEPHADIQVANRILTIGIQSAMFEKVLAQAAYTVDADISQREIEKICEKFRIQAMFSDIKHVVTARVLMNEGTIYINLGDGHRLFAVSKDGIRRVHSKEIRFRYSSFLKELAYIKGVKANFDLFYLYSPVKNEKHKLLLLAWMIHTFFDSNFPILLIIGPSGSGKSYLTWMVQELIDPSELGLQSPPSSVKDIVLSCIHSHLIALNNVTKFTVEQQNILCIISTGGKIPDRVLYTNSDLKVTELCRPVMINGLFIPFTQDDVLNRTVSILLPKLTPEDYAKTGGEKQWKNKYLEDLPSIFRGFYEMLQQVVAVRDSIELPDRLPRMSDFAITGIALEQVLGYESGTFMNAYEDNQQEGLILIIDGSEVAQSIITLTQKMYKPTTYTYKKLLSELKQCTGNKLSLPNSPRGLGEELRRIDKALADVQGIKLKFLERQRDGYKVEIHPPTS